jgi:hypothetical protein
MDFATAASQNEVNTFELFLHLLLFRKLQELLDFFITFIFITEIPLYETFVELCKHCFVMQPL